MIRYVIIVNTCIAICMIGRVCYFYILQSVIHLPVSGLLMHLLSTAVREMLKSGEPYGTLHA